MKPRVYIETTIPSYLTARPSRQVRRQAHQEATRTWWARRAAFELYVSRLVIDECADDDPQAAADRLAALAGVPLVDLTPEVIVLGDELIGRMKLPAKAKSDAYHIAAAACHDLEYLLTWNCRHIANAAHRRTIEAACRAAGRRSPVICTPEELLSAGGSDG